MKENLPAVKSTAGRNFYLPCEDASYIIVKIFRDGRKVVLSAGYRTAERRICKCQPELEHILVQLGKRFVLHRPLGLQTACRLID